LKLIFVHQGSQLTRPYKASVGSRRRAARGIHAVRDVKNTVEISSQQERSTIRREERTKDVPIEAFTLRRQGRAIDPDKAEGLLRETKIKAQDATHAVRRCINDGFLQVARGAKDDADPQSMTAARAMEEPSPRPDSTRPWLSPQQICRVQGSLSFCQDGDVCLLLPQPGEEVKQLRPREAVDVLTNKVKTRGGGLSVHGGTPPAAARAPASTERVRWRETPWGGEVICWEPATAGSEGEAGEETTNQAPGR
jgi:hypothetical protein